MEEQLPGKSRRILCISDSFGLPRPEVDYESTWIAILKKRLPSCDFIGCFRRLANTDILSTSAYGEYLRWYAPHAVIVQLGICDCSPRYLRTNSLLYKALSALPQPIANPAWKIVKLRKRSLDRTDVTPDKYLLNLRNYVEECRRTGVEGVVLVEIGIPSEKMQASNPLIIDSIARFNACINEVAQSNSGYVKVVCPLKSAKAFDYTSDGYHPNARGNTKVADALEVALRDFLIPHS